MTQAELRSCVDEILAAKPEPPIAECFDKNPTVPRNAWLSALVVACFLKDSMNVIDRLHAPVLGGEG